MLFATSTASFSLEATCVSTTGMLYAARISFDSTLVKEGALLLLDAVRIDLLHMRVLR